MHHRHRGVTLIVPELSSSRRAPSRLVRTTTVLDLGDVREAVLARALREAVLVDAPPVEDGAAERRGDVLERINTPCSTAEVRQRVPGRVPEPIYQARAARGRTRPGGCPG